jgi:invasion protein IalB
VVQGLRQAGQDVDICNVQNIVTASTGQVVTGHQMLELKGKVNRKVFQVTVPTGRLVPPGIGLQVDGGKAQKLEYVLCFPDRCIAEGSFPTSSSVLQEGHEPDADLGQLAEPAEPDQGFAAGFTGAFDGAPLQQGDIEDRQKKLQEFVPRTTRTLPRSSRKSRTRPRPRTDLSGVSV